MNVQTANPYIYKVNTGFDKTAMPIVSIDELYEKSNFRDTLNSKIIEVNGQKIDVSKLDKISFDDKDWYIPVFSEDVQAGLDYARTCFDFTNSGDFGKLTAAEDFTGMSDGEIYKAIYEKYQHCYGKNFYYASAIDYPAPDAEYDSYYTVIRRFNREVTNIFGSAENVREARREALYGDMSDYEVRQAIIDSYDTSDGLTFRELYKMTFDIWEVGLDGGLHNRLDILFTDVGTYDSPGNGNMVSNRERFLYSNVNKNHINKLNRIYNSGAMILPEYYSTLNQIAESLRLG